MKILYILPVVVFGGFGVLAAFGLFAPEDGLSSARQGGPAPDLTLAALPPKAEFTAEMLQAEGPKIVNIWASWCAPCRAEHPQLVDLSAKGIPVYGINYKDEPAKALGFLAELGDPYAAIGADQQGRTALDWGVYGVPETFVIDGDGQVILRFAGPITEAVLTNTIHPALKSASQ
ncbi:DsbE family thiol:disulfide interchange protein [Actibacterium sp. 188UL27-1]|uniref:DsbE family thiol:disulfide interchange protein n=1 Tax=Actibacterium sp. 188UL27-1 TaxID=2786961 RepID=UPI0019562B70|nr:DsbE family thiol:disulfide interchange protein [Actibacterium sp. 188UL27-1]MBM7066697.1 DsbE family thiol:disulfide interchange protein [Actibacterium sp. 188UL27-1]